MKFHLPLFPTCWLLLSCLSVKAAEQLPFLDGEPTDWRIPRTHIVWPENPGDADICIWEDDKLAAMSITIDDNCYMNVEWWLKTAEEHGFKITWFLITDRIDKKVTPKANGTWDDWNVVKNAGHDLQSHTAWHLHTHLPIWTGIEDEYKIGQEQINTNVNGARSDFLAYPGGPNTKLNSLEAAQKYYAGARGVGGGFNLPGKTNYFNTKTFAWPMDPENAPPFANPNSLLNPKDYNRYRGWMVLLVHGIKDYGILDPMLKYLDEHREDFWLGLYADVSRYGQERDTATLTLTSKEPTRLSYSSSGAG